MTSIPKGMLYFEVAETSNSKVLTQTEMSTWGTETYQLSNENNFENNTHVIAQQENNLEISI